LVLVPRLAPLLYGAARGGGPLPRTTGDPDQGAT
jgi:hypothetical protein